MDWLDLPRWLMGLSCHQLAERSPVCGDLAFPACFRCAGLYLGAAVAFGEIAVSRLRGRTVPPRPRPAHVLALTLPLVIDSWGGALGLWATPGWLRALTGWGVGLTLPPLLWLLAAGGTTAAAGAWWTAGLATGGRLVLGVVVGWRLAQLSSPTELTVAVVAATVSWVLLVGGVVMTGWRLLRSRRTDPLPAAGEARAREVSS